MQKEPIFLVILILLIIAALLFVQVKALKKGEIKLHGILTVRKAEQPILYYLVTMFWVIILVFLLSIVYFTVINFLMI